MSESSDDYRADMPAECAEIFNKSLLGYLKQNKDADDDQAMDFAKRALRFSGWAKRNGKWSKMKAHELVTREVGPVQIFKAGTWNGDLYTVDDLDNMLTAYQELRGYVDPPIQIGHTSDAFNMMLAEKMGVPKELITGDNGKGAMALGWISKMWREGDVLVANLSDIPSPLGELIEARSYKPVSVTVMWDYEFMGRRYPKVINSVSLLGFERQAVGEIQGLETAGVYVEIDTNKVVEFEDLAITAGDVHRDAAIGEEMAEDVSEADLEAIFNAFEPAAEAAIKGRNGARIFRVIMGELKGKMRSFLPKKNTATNIEVKEVVDWLKANGWQITEPADPRAIDFTGKTDEEGAMSKMAMAVLSTMLGIAEDATDEQINTAWTAYQAKAESGPEKTTELADLTTKVADYEARLGTLSTDLSAETRKRKLSEYSAVCQQFTHIGGLPSEMAEVLVTIEEVSPELAWSELLRYEALNRAQAQVGATVGTPLQEKEGSEPSEFMAKVTAYQAEKGCTHAEAINVCSQLHRDEFLAHRKSQ